MPTLSASDYTRYLKFKAAAISPIKPSIQTRDNVATSQSLLNSETLASQAAFVVGATTSALTALGGGVTTARTDIITGVVDAGSASLRYTTSQAHGLVVGDTITITGMTQGTFAKDPNRTATIAAVGTPTTFVIVVGSSTAGTAGVTLGSITGRVYYTTSAAHGVAASDRATVTGLTTFSVSDAAVLAVPTTTTFVLASSATGTAVTGASGVLTVPRLTTTTTALRGLARVQPVPVVQRRSTAVAKSTVSFAGTSGGMGSSPVQRPGGLPTGFKSSTSTYSRLPQQAGW